jgi:hypothetical protein
LDTVSAWSVNNAIGEGEQIRNVVRSKGLGFCAMSKQLTMSIVATGSIVDAGVGTRHTIFVANPISANYIYKQPHKDGATQRYRSLSDQQQKPTVEDAIAQGFVERPQVAFNGKAYWRWPEPDALAKLEAMQQDINAVDWNTLQIDDVRVTKLRDENT